MSRTNDKLVRMLDARIQAVTRKPLKKSLDESRDLLTSTAKRSPKIATMMPKATRTMPKMPPATWNFLSL